MDLTVALFDASGLKDHDGRSLVIAVRDRCLGEIKDGVFVFEYCFAMPMNSAGSCLSC